MSALAYPARMRGVGCIAQASLPLVFDFFAARRAEQYVELLRPVVA